MHACSLKIMPPVMFRSPPWIAVRQRLCALLTTTAWSGVRFNNKVAPSLGIANVMRELEVVQTVCSTVLFRTHMI